MAKDAGLKFVFSAVDHVSAVMGKVGKETDKLSASQHRLNAASQVIGAGAIIAFGAASIKAYAEAEKSQVKLQEAYRKFPALASVNISAMRDLNSAIQAKTGTDDDELAAAEAKLAMYNLTGEQIKQLIPIVNDYAVANGIGVTEAAGKVGKAMMGNAKALKDIGVNFKATGDRAKDFDTIYSALEGKVGGAGDAFGASTAGQLKILSASFGELQEQVGAQLVPALQSLVAIATPVLGAFSKLPDPLKSVAVGVGVLAAAVLILGPRLLTLKAGLEGAGAAGATASKGMGLASKALVVYSLAVAGSSMLVKDASLNTEGLSKALDDMATSGEAAGAAVKFFGENGATLEENLKWATGTGLGGFDKITYGLGAVESALGLTATTSNDATAQLKNLDAYLVNLAGTNPKAAAAALDYVRGKADGLNLSVDEVNRLLSGTVTALDGTSAAAEATAGSAETFTGAIKKAATSAEILKDAADALKASLDALGGKSMSVDAANSALEASFDDARETIKQATKDTDAHTDAVTNNKKALDLNTAAGRSAQGALASIATAADAVATAQTAAGASTDTIRASQERAREKFVAAAKAAGLGADAAEALARKYGLVPDAVVTAVKVERHEEALARIARVKKRLEELSKPVFITVDSSLFNFPTAPGTTNKRTRNAAGGPISGPGSGTSDSIPAMISNGEYVIIAASASRLGTGYLNSLNRYATGGTVASTPQQLLNQFVRDTATAIRLEQGLRQLRQDMAAQSRETRRNVRGFASLSNSFDTGAYKNAQGDVASARAALNSAATPAERTAALANLDQAEAAARTSRPTAGNVIAGLKAKLNVIKSFGKNLRTLAKKGLPSSFLQQIIDAGPEEGGELAKALLDSSPADMKELRALALSIDRESGRIGNQRARLEYDPLISRQRGLVNAAVARAGADRELLTTEVIVNLDGKEIATALAAYKRSVGGRKLGLD